MADAKAEPPASLRYPCERCPLRGRDAFRSFGDDELSFITRFKRGELVAAAGTLIFEEGIEATHLYTILSGWAVRHKSLPDGRRQILNFLLPGDLVGLQASLGEPMDHGVEALTDMLLCVFERDRFYELFDRCPSLAFDVTWLAALEHRLLDSNLLSVGRRTARERVAYLVLLLYRRAAGGSWTFRNLTEEIAGAAVIQGDVTVFLSTDNLVHVAGFDASGDLVMFAQDGNSAAGHFNFTFTNLAEDHLRANGMQMPQFVGGFVSYVTAWNGQNIAGVDPSGDIQAVWWSPGLPHWRVDNLSEQTGAPPITGALAPYLTSWGGINLAGADASGEILVTWWVPGFETWLTNNLTAEFSGPRMQADSISSYVTSWDGLNVAGIDENGHLTVYWWAPGLDVWAVSPLSELIPDATVPDGRIRGVTVEATGSINLLGAAPNGDVLRYWWQPGEPGWAVQNLTELA